jgi:hypothetical protein
MPVTNIQLDGVMITGNNRKALVRLKSPQVGGDKKKAQSPFVTVREGQPIGDYRVIKIDTKSIMIEKDGQSHTINLFAEGKIASPVAPSTPAGNPNLPPGAAVNMPPVPGQPNQPPNFQPRPQPAIPGQEPDQVAPAANVGMDPTQQVPGQIRGQVVPNPAAPEEVNEEFEE